MAEGDSLATWGRCIIALLLLGLVSGAQAVPGLLGPVRLFEPPPRPLFKRAGEPIAIQFKDPKPTPEIAQLLAEVAKAPSAQHIALLTKVRDRAIAIKDPAGEAVARLFLAEFCNTAGDPKSAIADGKATVDLAAKHGWAQVEVVAKLLVATAYLDAEDATSALTYAERAMKQGRAIGVGPELMVRLLGAEGLALNELGRVAAAVERLREVRKVAHDHPNDVSLAVFLQLMNVLANAEFELGQMRPHIATLTEVLSICRNAKLDEDVVVALLRLGYAHVMMSEFGEAIAYLEELVPRSGKDEYAKRMEPFLRVVYSRTRVYLALAYHRVGLNDKAEAMLTEAITLATAEKFYEVVAFAHGLRGEIYVERDQFEEAREAFELLEKYAVLAGYPASVGRPGKALVLVASGRAAEAIPILLEHVKDPLTLSSKPDTARGYLLLGTAYRGEEQYGKSIESFNQCILIAQRMEDVELEARALFGVSSGLRELERLPEAIVVLKRSVEQLQIIRDRARKLGSEFQAGLTERYGEYYRALAEMLAEQGRIVEAQQTLELLKLDELYQLVRRNANSAATIDLTPREREWARSYERVAADVARLGREFDAENQKDKPDDARLKDLLDKLSLAESAFLGFLKSAREEFSKSDAKTDRLDDVENSKALGAVLDKLADRHPAAVYTLVTKDGVRMIVQFSNTRILRQSDRKVTAAELNALILKFRTALTRPDLDPTPFAAELYDLLIRPIEADLAAAGSRTLLWSLDGALRYIPLAALWDAKSQQYLIEKYPTSIFTPATKDRLSNDPDKTWTGVALAVTKGRTESDATFSALPNAGDELTSVAKALAGEGLADEAFTLDVLTREMGRKRNKVIHIVSHFKFAPGDENRSYLLLGSGTLSLAKFKSLPNLMNSVDLLVLSACDTAVGDGADGAEFEGFGLLAQLNGAAAVLASLWPVDDRSTSLLMTEFYRQRSANPQLSKLEAMRQAQLRLLRGELSFTPGPVRAGSATSPDSVEGFTKWTSTPMRPIHPYYWAPFVLFGNFK